MDRIFRTQCCDFQGCQMILLLFESTLAVYQCRQEQYHHVDPNFITSSLSRKFALLLLQLIQYRCSFVRTSDCPNYMATIFHQAPSGQRFAFCLKKTVSPDFGLFITFTWCILVHKNHLEHLNTSPTFQFLQFQTKKNWKIWRCFPCAKTQKDKTTRDHHLYTWHFPNPSHSRLQWWWPLFLLRLWSSHHGPVEAPPTPPRLRKNTSL